MATSTYTSSEVSTVGSSVKGYVIVSITTTGKTTGEITVDFHLKGNSWTIAADISESYWSFSSTTVSGSLSKAPGFISGGDRSIAKITKSFSLPKSASSETLSFKFKSNLPKNGSLPHDYFSFNGSVKVTFPAGTYYKPPSNLSISTSEITTTSFKVTARWTGGEGSTDGACKVIVNGSTKVIDNDPVVFTGLSPNTSYGITAKLYDKKHNPDTTIQTVTGSALTLPGPPTWGSKSSTTNSVSLNVSANGNGATNLQYQFSRDKSNWYTSSTFSGLDDNTEYTFYARCKNTSTGKTSGSISTTYWTHPILDNIGISLVSGEEHSAFTVTANTYTNSSLIDYIYKENTIDSTEYKTSATSATWRSSDGVRENTTYTVRVRSKNRTSGFESATRSVSITTWHNPLTKFSIEVTNRWYYELSAKCSFSYSGTATIYMAIGDDQNWTDKGHLSGVVHTRDGLSPNTLYNIWAYIQDEHGRIYGNKSEKITTAYTLDDRSLYANGALKHLYANGILKTPDKVYVIQGDGTKICMNKIINNDPREG